MEQSIEQCYVEQSGTKSRAEQNRDFEHRTQSRAEHRTELHRAGQTERTYTDSETSTHTSTTAHTHSHTRHNTQPGSLLPESPYITAHRV